MKRRDWLGQFCLPVCGISLAWALPATAAPGTETLRLAMYMNIARDLNRADVRAVLEVWAQELTHKFEVPSEVFYYTDIGVLRSDFDAGRVNMVIADAMSFVRHFKVSELAEGFTTKLMHDASLLLLAKNGAKSHELAGKRVAQIVNDDISNTFLETLCLRQKGKTCQSLAVTRVPVSNNHQAVTRLLFDQADLALVNRHGFELAKELNPQLARVGQVVNELTFNTQYFGFFSARVAPAFRALALRSLPVTNTEIRGRQLLEVFKLEQITLAEPTALQPFYQLEKEYLELKARAGGKAAGK